MHIPFNNQYTTLGPDFYAEARPTVVAEPGLIRFNDELARELGITADKLHSIAADIFSGNAMPDGAMPLAMAYAGHQFGHFSPQLGDGRAILLGEVTGEDGNTYAIQLKGAGRTAFSRNGDGRAALGPVIREYLVSEAMHKLNVPTTRALAAVTTGETVVREQLLPGGVITRVARSFVRVGTFEFYAARDQYDAVKQLADFVWAHNYADIDDSGNPYVTLFRAMVERQAVLIARWMQLGFIHGVMNTDNMSVAGETIDYGPCAFMDAYQHDQVYSSIDHQGRYAYRNQPSIALWNLSRLAEAMLPLLGDTQEAGIAVAHEVLQGFIERYKTEWLAGFRTKLGLAVDNKESNEADRMLIEDLHNIMHDNQADFTLTFYHLSRLAATANAEDEKLRGLFATPAQIDSWLAKWRQRLSLENRDDGERQQAMQVVNPVYIPRNHRVEAAIRAAEDENDFSLFHELHAVLQTPYVEQHDREAYKQPPKPEEVIEQTFCGT